MSIRRCQRLGRRSSTTYTPGRPSTRTSAPRVSPSATRSRDTAIAFVPGARRSPHPPCVPRPKPVGKIVEAYLEAAAVCGLREVRITQGRGGGVQRHRVPLHLARSPHVEHFREAPADRGGWGATIAWLRRAD